MRKMYLIVLALLVSGIASAQDYPRVETFFGYTYVRANSASDVPSFSANGGSFQLGYNFNKHVGFVMDLGAVHNGNIKEINLDSTFANFLFGPRISFSRGRVRPYFQLLFGGVYATTSTAVTATPVSTSGAVTTTNGRASASQTAFAMATGVGIDIKINRHVSFRPISLDYYMTRLQNFRSLDDNNQHNLRYSAGLNFTFGGEAPTPPPPPPPPPPMKACWDGSQVPPDSPCPKRNLDLSLRAQGELCQGATLNITAPGPVPDGATYQWTIDGQAVSTQATMEFGTTGREPGAYKVGLRIAAPDYNDATTERTISVGAYRPPTGSLEASPREIFAGEKATLAPSFTPGNCGGALGNPVFTASEGSVSGNVFDSSEVRFDPGSSEQRKTITIVARVADEKGSATAQTALVVKKAAPTQARRLPDVIFPANNARVNNCGKRVLLEELKAMTDADPNGKVVFVGHVSEKEGKPGLDQQRALNAAAVISAGQGVCSSFAASRILVGSVGAADNGADYQSHFCGTTAELPGSVVKESESEAKFRRVEVWFVPSNGALPASVKDPRDAASLSVSNLGCPR